MKLYNYDENTKELKNESEANVSPLEENKYLIPANATAIKPLAPKEGFTQVLNNNIWEYVEDNRGTWFNVREEVEVTSLYKDMTGLTKEAIPYTQQEINSQRLQQLESMIDPHIMKPITVYNELNGLRFASPQNCKDWMDDDTYEHQAFCVSAWNYHKNVYLTVRAYQTSATVIPTDEEFQAVLDGVVS